MNEHKAWLTAKQAAELSGFTPRHIQNLIKRGSLPATRDDNGNYMIQKVDFFRLYPDAHKVHEARMAANDAGNAATKLLEKEVEHLKQLLTEKEKTTEYLKQQLENFTGEKKLMLEVLSSNQRMLEHQKTKSTEGAKRKILGIFPIGKN